MKKVLLLITIAALAGIINCTSVGSDRVSTHPSIKADTQNVVARPTEFTVEIDTNTWVEGKSYKGTELFGISFFENRFVSPTLLNKEGYDAYTLDAIADAINTAKSDSFHVVKAQENTFAFPHKRLPLFATYEVKVKGHPIKHKFLGPVSEQKADEIYAAGMSKDGLSIDIGAQKLLDRKSVV